MNMQIEVKVVNSVGGIMFTARISDSWVHILTMRDQTRPYIKSIQLVPAGTGNEGANKEYDVVYDGYCVEWEHFAAVGNDAN